MFVDTFSKCAEGQDVRHCVPLKYLIPVQERHPEFVASEQVRHSEWQRSQVFVTEFSKTLVAIHAVGHVVPSKYLPLGQELHWFAAAPVHSWQFP